jgi:hypothetical protein
MSRHLTTHLKELDGQKEIKKQAFHIRITAAEMFLHLLIDGMQPLQRLDNFLRTIWLECCGHMSSFEVKGKKYYNDWDVGEIGEKKSQKVSKIFKKGIKLDYQYDFGSTTYLEIEVLGEYKIHIEGGIQLLTRNEPLEILCHDCKKEPAIEICSVCMYHEASFFCKKCAKKHAKKCEDFEDYAAMPVVNSPRMGVCGYEGGQIDTERDGVWKG